MKQGVLNRGFITTALVAPLLLLGACSGPSGEDSPRPRGSDGTTTLGSVTWTFNGEERRWLTIAGTIRDKPRSSARLRKVATVPQVEIDAYASGAFSAEKFEVVLMYPTAPNSEPDLNRPGVVSVSYRPDGVLGPFWDGRGEKVTIESIEPEGSSAHIKATFTAELCRKERNSAPAEEDSCQPVRGVIDTRLQTAGQES